MKMRLRERTLSPLLRILGGTVVVSFFVAQMLCLIHCHFGNAMAMAGKSLPCHAKTKPCHEKQNSGPESSTCVSLKHPAVSAGSVSVTASPDMLVFDVPPSWNKAPLAAALLPETGLIREANHPDFVFTPVVSLRPALRSLAPPQIV